MIAILISDKIDFKTRNKEVHYIILEELAQQDDITLVNIYAPNICSPKYIKIILGGFKKEIGSNIVFVGDFSIPLSTMDTSSKQKNQQKYCRIE